MFVRSHLLLAGCVVAAANALSPAPLLAQEVVKIGLIVPMTGGQASTGKQIDNAVKLYMQQHGDTVAGKKIEVILKDDATLPDNTKRLAQELIVNDKVDLLAAGVSPTALSMAPVVHSTTAMFPLGVLASRSGASVENFPANGLGANPFM